MPWLWLMEKIKYSKKLTSKILFYPPNITIYSRLSEDSQRGELDEAYSVEMVLKFLEAAWQLRWSCNDVHETSFHVWTTAQLTYVFQTLFTDLRSSIASSLTQAKNCREVTIYHSVINNYSLGIEPFEIFQLKLHSDIFLLHTCTFWPMYASNHTQKTRPQFAF